MDYFPLKQYYWNSNESYFGAAFTHFRHIDGHMVSVVSMPYLDHSGYADKFHYIILW
jgi:hypothetical protein